MRILIVIGFVLTLVVPTRHATAQSVLVDESGTPAEQVLNIPSDQAGGHRLHAPLEQAELMVSVEGTAVLRVHTAEIRAKIKW